MLHLRFWLPPFSWPRAPSSATYPEFSNSMLGRVSNGQGGFWNSGCAPSIAPIGAACTCTVQSTISNPQPQPFILFSRGNDLWSVSLDGSPRYLTTVESRFAISALVSLPIAPTATAADPPSVAVFVACGVEVHIVWLSPSKECGLGLAYPRLVEREGEGTSTTAVLGLSHRILSLTAPSCVSHEEEEESGYSTLFLMLANGALVRTKFKVEWTSNGGVTVIPTLVNRRISIVQCDGAIGTTYAMVMERPRTRGNVAGVDPIAICGTLGGSLVAWQELIQRQEKGSEPSAQRTSGLFTIPQAHKGPIMCIDCVRLEPLSGNSRTWLICSGGDDRTVSSWIVTISEGLHSNAPEKVVQIAPVCRLRDFDLKVWDVSVIELRSQSSRMNMEIGGQSSAATGFGCLSACEDGCVRLHDLSSRQLLWKAPHRHQSRGCWKVLGLSSALAAGSSSESQSLTVFGFGVDGGVSKSVMHYDLSSSPSSSSMAIQALSKDPVFRAEGKLRTICLAPCESTLADGEEAWLVGCCDETGTVHVTRVLSKANGLRDIDAVAYTSALPVAQGKELERSCLAVTLQIVQEDHRIGCLVGATNGLVAYRSWICDNGEADDKMQWDFWLPSKSDVSEVTVVNDDSGKGDGPWCAAVSTKASELILLNRNGQVIWQRSATVGRPLALECRQLPMGPRIFALVGASGNLYLEAAEASCVPCIITLVGRTVSLPMAPIKAGGGGGGSNEMIKGLQVHHLSIPNILQEGEQFVVEVIVEHDASPPTLWRLDCVARRQSADGGTYSMEVLKQCSRPMDGDFRALLSYEGSAQPLSLLLQGDAVELREATTGHLLYTFDDIRAKRMIRGVIAFQSNGSCPSISATSVGVLYSHDGNNLLLQTASSSASTLYGPTTPGTDALCACRVVNDLQPVCFIGFEDTALAQYELEGCKEGSVPSMRLLSTYHTHRANIAALLTIPLPSDGGGKRKQSLIVSLGAVRTLCVWYVSSAAPHEGSYLLAQLEDGVDLLASSRSKSQRMRGASISDSVARYLCAAVGGQWRSVEPTNTVELLVGTSSGEVEVWSLRLNLSAAVPSVDCALLKVSSIVEPQLCAISCPFRHPTLADNESRDRSATFSIAASGRWVAYGRGSGYIGVVALSETSQGHQPSDQVAVVCMGERRLRHGAVQALGFIPVNSDGSYPSFLMAGSHGGAFSMLQLQPALHGLEFISLKEFFFATPIRFMSIAERSTLEGEGVGEVEGQLLIGEEGSLLHLFRLRLPHSGSASAVAPPVAGDRLITLERTHQLHVRRLNGASIVWFPRHAQSFGADVIVVGQGVQRLIV